MINNTLPRRIRYTPGSATFSAVFNAITPGKYNFNGQIQVFIPELVPNTVYLIDTISIGGNVAAEDYLTAISTVPTFSLKKTNGNENIFDKPFPIQSFWTDRQIARFFKTGMNNTGISASLTGILAQIPAFIGVGTISLAINLSIYAIDSKDFEREFTRAG